MSAELRGTPRSLTKNAISQIGGRLTLSLGRLLAMLMITRLLGAESFGAYALVVNFVTLFEWLTDFGQTDISVRNICRQPEREQIILKALGIIKLVQGPLSFLLLPLILYIMQYPAEIVRAGAVGGIGLLFYAAVQIYRVVFKVRMCMERDVLAELGGLCAMLPLTWVACVWHARLELLVGCYTLSRVVFFGLAVLFARRSLDLATPRTRVFDAMEIVRQGVPLGMIGLLVAIYDLLGVVLVSKLMDMGAVAQLAAATRFVFPVIIIVQALNSAFYPPLSAVWSSSRQRLQQLQQTALFLSIFVAGFLFAGIHAGAHFLMALMGPSIAGGAIVLEWMSWVVLARAITASMSPLIVIAGRQGQALWFTVGSILLQIVAVVILVPRYGIVGAAVGYLAVELALGVVPVSWMGQVVSTIRISWWAPIKLIVCAAIAVEFTNLLSFSGTVWSAMLSAALYLALSIGSGALSVREVRFVIAEVLGPRPNASVPTAVSIEQGQT